MGSPGRIGPMVHLIMSERSYHRIYRCFFYFFIFSLGGGDFLNIN